MLVLDYPDRPNFTLPNPSPIPSSQYSSSCSQDCSIKPCPLNSASCISLLGDFKKAIHKLTDVDMLNRLCANLSTNFNFKGDDILVRIAMEAILDCDKIVPISDTEQCPPT
jgi:hypothetical protein